MTGWPSQVLADVARALATRAFERLAGGLATYAIRRA
jgi:hypothetical protein